MASTILRRLARRTVAVATATTILAAGLAAGTTAMASARPAREGSNARLFAQSGRSISPLLPAQGTYFGAFVNSEGTLSQRAVVSALETRMGRRLAINHIFLPRGKDKIGPQVAVDIAQGRIPLITFGSGYASTEVAAGRYDTYFGALAGQIRALRGPVYLRYAHEMDGRANVSWVQSPSAFIAAWRHVYALFHRLGVTTSAWVWEPNAFAFAGSYGATRADAYYPGDAYVDWVGADGYNWGSCRGGSHWRSFADTFKPFYAWGLRNGKPMMVSEFGTVEHPTIPTAKADWYRQAAQTLATTMPQIRAAVYFSSRTATKGCDWRPETSATSLAGFVAMARTPVLTGLP